MDTKIKWTDTGRENFYTELQALLSAGLDFSSTFLLLIETHEQPGIRKLLQRLYSDVTTGNALWQAMASSGAFARIDCGVVRIGEETGRLAESLVFLTDYYRNRAAQRRMISSALSYPVVILTIAVAVVAFMLSVVVPMFEEVYARMGGELPGLTQRIIRISKAFPACSAAVLLLATLVFAGCRIKRKDEKWRQKAGTCMLRLPLAGRMLRRHYESQCCVLLHLLLSSGIPLLSGIELLADVIGSTPYRTAFREVARRLEQGQSFHSALEAYPILFDRRLAALVRVGEQTNRLPEMLYRSGDTLRTELQHGVKRLESLLEPSLILFVGILVAIILIAMYMPMFRLGSIMS